MSLSPVVLAGAALLAAPAAALAASGTTTSAVTTYVVNVDKASIDVTVTYTIKNTVASKVQNVDCGSSYICTQTTRFYYDTTYVKEDAAGGAVAVTSNAGKVKQSVDSESSLARTLKLSYPPVWYGQTRVVTSKYTIPAGPGDTSGFRALKAYASLCVFDNVPMNVDSGSVNVVVPDGFSVITTGGSPLPAISDADGLQTFGSGATQTESCLVATNPSALVKSTASSGSSAFDLQSWPEDAAWVSKVEAFAATDLPKLEELTGLPAAAGPYTIKEAGTYEIGLSVTSPSGGTGAAVGEDAAEAQVIQAMAQVVYAPMFADPWMSAGLAAYSERLAGAGQYVACTQPTGSPDLTNWQVLTFSSSQRDRSNSSWQAQAACYVFTSWADAVGPDRFKAALVAADKGENPYMGAGADPAVAASDPISARTLLDMIDERGMVPAGVADLDGAQKLLASYGVFSDADLAGRSAARARYHALAAAAGTWQMPLAIRSPMADWDFAAAQKAMDDIEQILSARDHAEDAVTDLHLDGTDLQKQFEAAATQADLDAVLATARGESDAADKYVEASKLNDGSRTILQSIGLLLTDVATPLDRARSSLDAVNPDEASKSAQTVIDAIKGSSEQGTIRVGVIVGLLLASLLLIGVSFLIRRRRQRVLMASLAASAVTTEEGLLAAALAVPPAGFPAPGDRPDGPVAPPTAGPAS